MKCHTKIARLAPWDKGAPEIHGPKLYGARAGLDFLYLLPVTGERPILYGGNGLPEGLTLDKNTGIISGIARGDGVYELDLTAENKHGTAKKRLSLHIGDTIALTPPMGYNSWNCFNVKVNQQSIMEIADAMISTGIAAYGYEYVVTDDTWQGERGGELNAIMPNKRFPDMKVMCDHIHALGLKAGIYSSPWLKTPGRHIGSTYSSDPEAVARRPHSFGEIAGEPADALQWARWGFDYLKYDWCPMDGYYAGRMHDALEKSGRSIFLSISSCGRAYLAESWANIANCWRTTNDVYKSWDSICQAFEQHDWVKYSRPGHWNDPDMLVLGQVVFEGPPLTRDEMISHFTLWCMLAAPLMIGCDIRSIDNFTLSLLCHDELLAIDQDPLGKQGVCVWEQVTREHDGGLACHLNVYRKELYDGAVAVAVFNRGEEPAEIHADWEAWGIQCHGTLRDLWAKEDIGRTEDRITIGIAPHGAQLYRITPQN